MIPSPWHFVLLALAVYRATRFLGWDDWPPIEKLRSRLLGEQVGQPYYVDPTLTNAYPTTSGPGYWEQPDPTYRRPTLAHLVHCPFCLGAWISVVTYLLWLPFPHAVVALAVVPALSAAAGLLAKNLDP